jgi:hypothetical protein
MVIHESKQPTNEHEIGELERVLDIRLPSDYRSFLLRHNGGRPEPSSFFAYLGPYGDSRSHECVNRFLALYDGEYSNLKKYIKSYKDRIPVDFLPIARDPFGNLICLAVAGPDYGKVFFWDHELEADEGETPDYRNISFVANSFDEFLNSLH